MLHSGQAVLPSCTAAPKSLAYSYVPNVLLVIYLFFNFYRINYREKTVAGGAASCPSPSSLARATCTMDPAALAGRRKHE